MGVGGCVLCVPVSGTYFVEGDRPTGSKMLGDVIWLAVVRWFESVACGQVADVVRDE